MSEPIELVREAGRRLKRAWKDDELSLGAGSELNRLLAQVEQALAPPDPVAIENAEHEAFVRREREAVEWWCGLSHQEREALPNIAEAYHQHRLAEAERAKGGEA